MHAQRVIWLVAIASGLAGGCQPTGDPKATVPEPIHLLLPQRIRIHPFTEARTFDESGGVRGVEVRIEALDAYGDATKAFGQFRFELYRFRPQSPDPKGPRVVAWPAIDLVDPEANAIHWDSVTRTYEFRLQWGRSIPVDYKFVLVAVFDSPFTERMFNERVFVTGE
jgi:hypothetical protein